MAAGAVALISLVGVGLLVVLMVFGWYLSYLARRLDRLHHRVDAAAAGLAEHLARRAGAAAALASALPRSSGEPLAAAAVVAAPGGAQAQSALTRQLVLVMLSAEVLGGPGVPGVPGVPAELVGEVADASRRARLARRFHNDAVAHAQRMRRKRVVRWARLAGRAPWPAMVEFDDSLPEVWPACGVH